MSSPTWISQPILEIVASEFPALRIYAYIDDISFASKDSELIANAYNRLRVLLTAKLVELSPTKCVWFEGIERIPIPHVLQEAGVLSESRATKILGAFVGEKESVSEKLVQKVVKHQAAFRRLQHMGASNVSIVLLSHCVNMRHRYDIRVHLPDASLELSRQFDSQVANTLCSWFGNLNEDQISWMRLPLKKGGLGLTPTEPIREAAFFKSKRAVMERPIHLSAPATLMDLPALNSLSSQRPLTDEAVTEEVHHNAVRESLMKDKGQADNIRVASAKGNYNWLTACTKFIPSRLFTLAIMPRFGIEHPLLPSKVQCPGCHVLLTSSSAIAHVSGCVKCSGINATTKHNRMVRQLYTLCIKAGIPCELEPRQFATYTCGKCGTTVDGENKASHQRTCGSGSFHHSGPDLVIHWADGDIFYDFTVIHELSQSNIKRSGAILMRDAIKIIYAQAK